jgi:uncharacterized surface protein with fasciclin (FAS1) repeats
MIMVTVNAFTIEFAGGAEADSRAAAQVVPTSEMPKRRESTSNRLAKAASVERHMGCPRHLARVAHHPGNLSPGKDTRMTHFRTMLLTAAGCLLATTGAAQACSGCGAHGGQATKTSCASRQGDIVDTAAAAGSFKTLAAALQAAGLVDAMKGEGPFTVFAPTDDAFAKLPAGTLEKLLKPQNKALLTAILTYHVAPGRFGAEDVIQRTNLATLNGQRIDIEVASGVRVNDANVIKADIECSNGVIHVIDRVIMPTSDSILETAARAGSFQTLAAAVKTAGLVEALSGEGPFTVFAPTDAAFAKLPAGTVENLLKPENRDQLMAILKYHVVPGRVYASDALAAETARTAQGSRVRFTVAGGTLMVNGASIVHPDLEATNGVIHVIDEVILPG